LSVGEEVDMAYTPWAILLCKFRDHPGPEPYPRQRFDELFTVAGRGKFGMVDFFRDMSHGHIDLSGSQVFPPGGGWYTLAEKLSDYAGPATPNGGRNALLRWGRKAAAEKEHDLSGFSRVVMVTNVGADLFGGLEGAATNDDRDGTGMSSLSPSMMGQEMGHGYGLDHSRLFGSDAEYADPWDTMSTRTQFMGPHPVYTDTDSQGRRVFRVGPGLNAANMWGMDWLDGSRVWTAEGNSRTSVILRPLHRLDLSGYLCVRAGDLFVEFRMNEGWDNGFAAPLVLVHSFASGYSILHGAVGVSGVVTYGDTSDAPLPAHGEGVKVTVTAIDPTARTATIDVQRWAAWRPSVGPGAIFGNVAGDGGGWMFINGKIRRIPPNSPLRPMLDFVLDAHDSESIRHGVARNLAQVQAYEGMARLATQRALKLTEVRQPAARARRSHLVSGPDISEPSGAEREDNREEYGVFPPHYEQQQGHGGDPT
jgi:hypothetical protein